MISDRQIRIEEINPARLDEYRRVPIAFAVKSILRVELVDGGLGGVILRETPVEPYIKDYDAHGETPEDWPSKFDVRNWGFFLAINGGMAVGAAAVAFDTAGVNMLEGRRDLSVLWDIRVHPDWRGREVGKALFEYAAAWSRERDCTQMKVETQNINVQACRFYRRMGCELGEVRRFGYVAAPEAAHEVMLCWYLTL